MAIHANDWAAHERCVIGQTYMSRGVFFPIPLLALVAACAAELQLTASSWRELTAANAKVTGVRGEGARAAITLTHKFSMDGYGSIPLCLACLGKEMSLTIRGSGAVLDANQTGQIFTIGSMTTVKISEGGPDLQACPY